MRAGELDQRVSLQRREQGQYPDGQPYDDWVIVGTCWASVHPLRGREIIAADAVASITDVRVRMRYRPGITSAMQVLHGSDTYEITSVIDVKSARRELELLCKRVT